MLTLIKKMSNLSLKNVVDTREFPSLALRFTKSPIHYYYEVIYIEYGQCFIEVFFNFEKFLTY